MGRESGWLNNAPYTTKQCATACTGYKYSTVSSSDSNCKCTDTCHDSNDGHKSYYNHEGTQFVISNREWKTIFLR